MLKFLTRFSALMAVLIISALPLDAFAIRPRYKAVSYNTSRPAFERLVRGLSPTMDIRPGKSTTTDLESIRVSQIDSTIGSVSFTQATDANKPLLTEGGRREQLFVQSEDFTTTWIDTRSTATLAGTHPEGFTTHTLTEDSSASTTHYLYQANNSISGVAYRTSIDVKRGTGTRHLAVRFSGGFAANSYAYVDMSDCTIDSTSGGITTATATDIGSSWCRVSAEAPATSTQTAADSVVYYIVGTLGSSFYSGDGSSSLLLARPIYQRASMNPTYIPTQTLPRHGSLTGQRGLRGDSTDYLATAAYNSATDFTGDFSLFAIVEPTGFSSSTNYTILDNETFNTKGVIWRLEGDNVDSLGVTLRTNQAAAYTQLIPSGSYPIFPHVPVIASAHKSSTSGSLFFDLDSYKTGTLNNAVSASTNATGLMAQDSGSQPLDGYFYRAVGYKKALPTSTRQRLIKGFKRFYRVN